ncbi:hypothetical protein QQ020_35460 [Fulvivirgaceae bacterium BMA12]|uniref:Uncharacterized protein n=1 Tax=Agaribacillus aureus TaxID=3051825 RepID=A0ABT8LKJ7_9BACT|nr:hypothetical protein [Fulvivirgaceae bacterium BMA12]
MPLKLNYSAARTLLYNLIRSEYEADMYPKGTGPTTNIITEGNADPDKARFYGADETQRLLDNILATLRVCGRIKKVKALAWVKKKMLLSAHVLIEDSAIYSKLLMALQIDENEVNQMMSDIS